MMSKLFLNERKSENLQVFFLKFTKKLSNKWFSISFQHVDKNEIGHATVHNAQKHHLQINENFFRQIIDKNQEMENFSQRSLCLMQ